MPLPPANASRRLAATLVALAALSAEAARADIFTSRPPRVTVAEPGQSLASPVAYREWMAGEEAPPAAAQDLIRLTPHDALALWVPLKDNTTTTDPYAHFYAATPALDAENGLVAFDLYHRLNGLVGHAVTGPAEQGYWIGQLDPGEYTFELREWDLPDAPIFEPPGPWQDTIADATLRETTTWTFRVGVPEPAAATLVTLGLLVAVRPRRGRGLR